MKGRDWKRSRPRPGQGTRCKSGHLFIIGSCPDCRERLADVRAAREQNQARLRAEREAASPDKGTER